MPLNSIGDANNRRSQAWRVFFDASTRLQGILETKLKKAAGITLADYNILLTLYEAPGRSLRMGELADRTVFSPSRLTYLVSRLEKSGWVRKHPADGDGRGYVAALTKTGVELTEASTAIHQETVRRLLLDDLTDSEIDRIVEAFERVDEQSRP
ncbi:MarR family winged helix-turn-helix transcriptional regulator [Scrofimicrobium sp. R131]|uniref:MarR family transcriptional regulator n=1 Tax=Scrofimicrobium appendicitidis TaxID=3079930 RepID=A0AAU7V4R8_9ACTO